MKSDTITFEKLLAGAESTPPPLASAREQLAHLQHMRSITYPEGETLADSAVDKQRRIVADLEREAMQ